MSEYTLRDKALSLPANHPARIKYRDYVRAQANAREEVNAGQTDHGHLVAGAADAHLRAVTEAVETAIRETGVTLSHFGSDGQRLKNRPQTLVTIYRIECTKSYRMDGQGVWYSLEPWGEDTEYFEGGDDGGQEYLLPDGYHVGEDNICCLSIFDDNGTPYDLITHHDGPAIVTRDGRVLGLRKPGEPEETTDLTATLKFRLSPAQKARLADNAAEAGLSIGAYIRQRCCE